MNKPPKPPKDHHFVPQFYLKKWVNDKGDLRVYHKKWSKSIGSKKPKGICFQENLYTRRNMNVDVETEFFQKVDNDADKSLTVILNEGVNGLSEKQKEDFTLFFTTLYIRSPEGLEKNREIGDFLSGLPRDPLDDMAAVLTYRTDDPSEIKLRTEIANSEWIIFENTKGPKLLTNDNPLILDSLSVPTQMEQLGYEHPKEFLYILPISPIKLLLISNKIGQANSFLQNEGSISNLFRTVNGITVSNAKERIIGQDASTDKFVLRNIESK